MKCRLIFLALFFYTSSASLHAQSPNSYVDPFIGSGGHGHVFVGASTPFGAVQLGPENIFKGWDWCSGYHYSDSVLMGFSHTHLSGTGGYDLGDVLIMPYTGPVRTNKGSQQDPLSGYSSYYSHGREKASPGYYSVDLMSSGIGVELTASERVGFHQYHFPAGRNARVIIDLQEGIGDKATNTHIEQKDAYTIEGWRWSRGWAKDQRIWFAIRSSEPIGDLAVYNGDSLLQGHSGTGLAIKGLISWEKAPATLRLKVGISPVSEAGALANIEAEIPHWDFERTRKEAAAKWNKELSRVSVETRNEAEKKVFYTALYHTMIDPSLFNDHNGDYRGTDKKEYHNAPFANYSIFSLWDTYRAIHPLYTILQPERVRDMVRSMLAIYQQQGKLPIWHLDGNETNLMPGISGVQVVAEAYLKGIGGFDPELAFRAVKASALRDEYGLNYVKSQEYIPSDKVEESVAKAMEYCISDGSVALMAKKMGKMEDYALFFKRAKYYRHYFDPATKFFRGKRADGSWNPVFEPGRTSHPWIDDYSEGNAWQYTWLAPQDVDGLITLLGGDQAFIERLDRLFTEKVLPDPAAPPDIAGLIGQYAHGNEPGHHTTYLYAYAGAQWKTAEKVRYILKNMYQPTIDGISGNEDCGQMSAWYIFSSIGFYPVFPASGAYVLGSPLFDKVTIDLSPGRQFILEAVNNGPENIYIQSAEWNGKKIDRTWIRHSELMKGGRLRVVMGKEPNKAFGQAPGSRPRSNE